jgi:hypothetical protein
VSKSLRGLLVFVLHFSVRPPPSPPPSHDRTALAFNITRLQMDISRFCRYTRFAGPLLLLESSARSLHVPFGDYFSTEETWLVTGVEAQLPVQRHECALPAEIAAACAQVRRRFGGDMADADARARCCRFVLGINVK